MRQSQQDFFIANKPYEATRDPKKELKDFGGFFLGEGET